MKKSSKPEEPTKRRRRQANDNQADWTSIEPGLLREVIEAVTNNGGAVRFGYSRDGGAYSIGIYGDGKPFTEFLGANEDIDGWLEGIKLDYE